MKTVHEKLVEYAGSSPTDLAILGLVENPSLKAGPNGCTPFSLKMLRQMIFRNDDAFGWCMRLDKAFPEDYLRNMREAWRETR